MPDATRQEYQQGPLQANKWETFISSPNTAGFSSKIVAAFSQKDQLFSCVFITQTLDLINPAYCTICDT